MGRKSCSRTASLSLPKRLAGARWSLHTPKGDFSFTLHDVPWGEQKTFLDGAVAIDRVPPTTQLTTSDDDEDFPAIAHRGDEIWMSFVRFSHSDRAAGSLCPAPEARSIISITSRAPPGGDQVFAMRYSPDTGTWSEPVAVSPKGENVGPHRDRDRRPEARLGDLVGAAQRTISICSRA